MWYWWVVSLFLWNGYLRKSSSLFYCQSFSLPQTFEALVYSSLFEWRCAVGTTSNPQSTPEKINTWIVCEIRFWFLLDLSLSAKWHWNEVQDIETRFMLEASILNNCDVSQQCFCNPKFMQLLNGLVLGLVTCVITNANTNFQVCCWRR